MIGPAGSSGGLALRGLFIGDDEECFNAAAKLSLEVNFTLVPRPIQKVSSARSKERVGQSWWRSLFKQGGVRYGGYVLAPAVRAATLYAHNSPKLMHRGGHLRLVRQNSVHGDVVFSPN